MTSTKVSSRRKITKEETPALAELNTRSHPPWLQASPSLPFSSLSPDEFEVFSFLLLLKERRPGEQIYYYGKTKDLGRDIVVIRQDQTVELIQCKHYSGTIGPKVLKQEMAKLCMNIFSDVFPEKPDTVTFYVSTDLTAAAVDFLSNPGNWRNAAEPLLRRANRGRSD